jgi:hypothetical protein
MEERFPWPEFDRLAKMLQSSGYVVIVVGPIVGLVMLIMGEAVLRISGFAILFGSVLIGLYHMCFASIMNALHDIANHGVTQEPDKPGPA